MSVPHCICAIQCRHAHTHAHGITATAPAAFPDTTAASASSSVPSCATAEATVSREPVTAPAVILDMPAKSARPQQRPLRSQHNSRPSRRIATPARSTVRRNSTRPIPPPAPMHNHCSTNSLNSAFNERQLAHPLRNCSCAKRFPGYRTTLSSGSARVCSGTRCSRAPPRA